MFRLNIVNITNKKIFLIRNITERIKHKSDANIQTGMRANVIKTNPDTPNNNKDYLTSTKKYYPNTMDSVYIKTFDPETDYYKPYLSDKMIG